MRSWLETSNNSTYEAWNGASNERHLKLMVILLKEGGAFSLPAPFTTHTHKHTNIAILLKYYRVLTWIVLKTKCQEKEV